MAELPTLTQTAEKRELHLRDYWATIWRWRWTVAATFVIFTTVVALYTFLQTPIYRASSKVEIQASVRRVAPVADVSEMGNTGYSWYAEDRYYNTQFEVIKSRAVAEKVFDRLDLWNDPEFKGLKDPIGAFKQRVMVEPVEMTGIVIISIEGSNREKTTEWVNTLAEVYVDRNMELAKRATERAVTALLEQIDPLRTRLQRTQEATFEIAEKAQIIVPEDQQKILMGTLTKYEQDLAETQLALVKLDTILGRVDEVSRSGGSFLTIPEIAADTVVADLYGQRIELERDIQKLRSTLQERHVKVVEKEAELERLDQKISAEASRVINRLRTEQALKQDQERKIGQQIGLIKGQSISLNQKASSFDLSRSDAAETKKLFDLINTRIKEIEISSQLLNNNLRIMDRAEVPLAPVRPRKALNLFLGVLSGLLLGVGLAFFLEYLDNTVKTTEDVEHYLKLHILSIIPKVSDDSSYAVRESLQTLRTSLLFSRKNRASNAVLFTSAGPQEGKSTTLVSLARTMAGSGDRIAVLDCDLRRPTIHTHLELDKRDGMTNYILAPEGASWREYLKNSKVPNLYAMTSGPLPPNPPDIFGSDRFAQLLSELKSHFDWVFIDSPPVASLTDSILLASMADLVAFVVRHNQTDKELVRRAVGNVRNVNPNVIGAILNHVDLERSSYRDYYYVGYYYYGEGKGSKGQRQGASLKVAPPTDSVGEKVAR